MSDLKTNLEQILQEKETKIIPDNIKKDIQIFDITGTYEGNSGDVKLFETEEEMQADAKAKDGDLAVVYRNEVNNVTADSRFQYVTFPKTVTLPTAVTTSSRYRLIAVDSSTMFDGQVNLNNTSFSFNGYSETGMIRVEYSSADGINYTRTRFEGDNGELTNPVDLGTEVLIYGVNSFTANMGYFMQIDGSTFEGLYEYSFYKDKTKIKLPLMSGLNIQYDSSSNTISSVTFNKEFSEEINFTKLASVYDKFISDTNTPNSAYIYLDNNNNLKFVQDSHMLCYDKNVSFLGASVTISTDTDTTAKVYNINLENETYTLETNLEPSGHIYGNSNYNWNYYNLNNKTIPFNIVNSKPINFNHICVGDTVSSKTSYTKYIEENDCYIDTSSYILAPTQLTLAASNELLPGKTAYGKNGIVIGDDTIYDNLDNEKVWNKIFNISTSISDYSSMQDEVSPQYRLGNYSYMELLPNKLYAFNRDKDSDKYLLRNIANGNIFNNPIGVGNNVLYYYSLANSNLTIYELNKTSNNIKSYNIDLGTTTKKFSVSASNGLVYMLYSTDGKDIYVKRYSLETQELDELYYNADDLYTYFGTIVAAQGNAIYTYRNKQDVAYNINLINGTTKQITTISGGYVSANIYGYSEDQKIIYGNYNNPTKSWWVYDFTTSQFYTFDTDVAPSNGQLHNFCDANKVFLGFKSDRKNISIYNTDTHSLYLQPITNFNGSYVSNFILKKDRYIYASNLNNNCKINLDTFTAEPLSISFSSSNKDKYPIDIEETSTSVYIVRPSTEGLSYETCYKVTASSIDLTKTNDFIILFTYRTNTTGQVIVVFVDNTLSDGVLTQEEYDTALSTAKQIEGSE